MFNSGILQAFLRSNVVINNLYSGLPETTMEKIYGKAIYRLSSAMIYNIHRMDRVSLTYI